MSANRSAYKGESNEGSYRNPELDLLARHALPEPDEGAGKKLIVWTIEIANTDVSLIPLLFLENT